MKIIPTLGFIVLCLVGNCQSLLAADIRSVLGTSLPELEKIDLPEDEINQAYSARNFSPFWNFTDDESGSLSSAFLDSLEQIISYHGLKEADYPFDAIKKYKASHEDRDRDILDILVTASILRLAHDLHGDSTDLAIKYPGWSLKRNGLDLPSLLAGAIEKGNLNEFITSLVPKHNEYLKLATALKTYRSYLSKGEWQIIDAGPALLPKERGPRVEQLRSRLEAEDYLQPTTEERDFFDDALQKALTNYQLRNGLQADGHCDKKTQASLNMSIKDRIGQIRANMERWRHIPEDFPPDRLIEINIADASIRIMEKGHEIYAGPVVIGKVDRKTPFIASKVRSMIINPIWHVPTKIAQKDILPKLKKDPHYLEKLGFVIKGNEDDPYGENIDWSRMPERAFNFRLRQSPGDQNSLGPIKFDFDNDFAVYMHGTPHQELFAKPQRNFSSGCIRLRDPEDIGEILLKDTAGDWNADKISAEIDKEKTRWVGIRNPMPIYVLYWTVFADEVTGAINFRKDAYDYDHILEDAPTVPEQVIKP